MDTERLKKALVAADAAGDVEAARAIAKALRGAQKADPTEGMTRGGKFFAGVGKEIVNMGRGALQAMSPLADAEGQLYAAREGLPYEKGSAQKYADQKVIDARERDAPLNATTAGKVGSFVGNVAMAAPTAFIPGANTYAGAGMIGGALGMMQPTAGNESRTQNTAMGSAGGMFAKFIGDRLFNPFLRQQPPANAQAGAQAGANVNIGPGSASAQNSVTGNATTSVRGGGAGFGSVGDDASAGLTAAQQRAMDAGRALGMRATPGQATGSRALQQMEAKLESQPMTSGPFNAIKEANSRVLNRSAAEAIGETADVVDSQVLARANERIGAAFEAARDATPRPIDARGFVGHLQSVADEFEGLLPNGQTVGQHPLVQRLFRYAETGEATGEQLGGLTSKLGRAAYKEMTSQSGDREMGQALYMVKDYVDDLIEGGLDGQTLANYQAARGQYRNLLTLLKPGVTNPSTGNVSGATLANVLQRTDKNGFTFGNNNSAMYAASRFAQAFKPIVGDSGTATRSMITNPMEAVASIPFNIATRLYTSTPAVNAAVGAQAAGQAAQGAASPFMTPAAGLLPKYLPGVGGLLGTYAGQ